MQRTFTLIFLVGALVAILLSAHSVLALPVMAEDAVVTGVLTFDKRFVAVRPHIPGKPMRVTMRFDPQDQQELTRRSGFFLLDGDRLRSFLAGGSLLDNNLAAGNRESNRPANELVATLNQPSGDYTIIIYNDTDIPLTYRLWVENGTFPEEEVVVERGETGQGADQSESSQPATVVPIRAQAQPNVEASSDASTDAVHVVQAGETLSLIAQSVYGNLSLYDRLCSYNSIGNCNVIEIGQALRTPPLAVLTGAAAPVAQTASGATQAVVSSAAGSTSESYTVVAGDTLGTIAQKLYGDFQRYSDICALNGLADCSIVTIGQVLRLPDSSSTQPLPDQAQISATPVQPTPATSVPTATQSAPQESDVGIVPALEQSTNMSIFVMLWKATGLLFFLETDGPFTLFVPSDTAFAPAVQANLNSWMNNKQVLEQLLSYHVLVHSFDPDSVTANPVEMGTLEGRSVRLERAVNGELLVNGAQVIGSPISASNGTIYTVDQVLSPSQ